VTDSGAQLLDDLHGTFCRYVMFPDEHCAVSVVLWTATTHALQAFQHAPRLVINSPEKRCGKSRLLDVIAGTCHDPLVSVNATVAAIYRSIGAKPPAADWSVISREIRQCNDFYRERPWMKRKGVA